MPMRMNMLKGRIARSKLEEKAAGDYEGLEGELVQQLQKQGKKVLVGIQHEEGAYTLLGEDGLYYCTIDGEEGVMDYTTLFEAFRVFRFNSFARGYEWMPIPSAEGTKEKTIWLKDGYVLTALWNISMYIAGSSS